MLFSMTRFRALHTVNVACSSVCYNKRCNQTISSYIALMCYHFPLSGSMVYFQFFRYLQWNLIFQFYQRVKNLVDPSHSLSIHFYQRELSSSSFTNIHTHTLHKKSAPTTVQVVILESSSILNPFSVGDLICINCLSNPERPRFLLKKGVNQWTKELITRTRN